MIVTEEDLAILIMRLCVFKGNEILCQGCFDRAELGKRLAFQIAKERGWDTKRYLPYEDEDQPDGI